MGLKKISLDGRNLSMFINQRQESSDEEEIKDRKGLIYGTSSFGGK